MSNKGLIFVRKLGSKTILVTVVDTEAVQKLQPESQHFLVVQTGDNITTLSILHTTYRDRKEEAYGCTIDNLLTSGIWQN